MSCAWTATSIKCDQHPWVLPFHPPNQMSGCLLHILQLEIVTTLFKKNQSALIYINEITLTFLDEVFRQSLSSTVKIPDIG